MDAAAPAEAVADVLEGIGDVFYALDREWRLTYANARAFELWGRPRESVLGRRLGELFAEWQGSESHRAHLQAAQEGRPLRLRTVSRIFHRPIELNIFPGAAGLFVHVRDLSGERRIEAERQVILDTMAQGVAAFDGQGRTLYRNAAARAILGIADDLDIPTYIGAEHPLAPRRMDGRPLPREEHPAALALRGKATRGLELRLKRLSDRREIVCRYDAVPLRDEEGAVSGAIITFQDITREVEAAAALQQREELLRLAQKAAHVGSFSWDVPSGLVVVSPTFEEIYGQPAKASAHPRDFWISRVHPEDKAVYDRLRTEAFDRREPEFRGQFRILRPDGAQRWVESRSRAYYDEAGRPQRVVGIQVDITAQKEAEAALRASEGRLRLALEFSKLGDWSWDAATDVVTLSARAAELLGVAPGAGITWRELRRHMHPDDRERARIAFERAVLERADYDVEYRVQRPEGAQVWIAARARAHYDADGRPLGMIGVMQDVSARKESEERQKLLMAELDHRVKNVLAVVQALAQQTLRSDRREVADFAGRLAALARAHSLLATRSWQGASLRALLEETLSPYAGKDGRAAIEGADLLLKPKAAQALTLAFHEMATNAAKYGALSAPAGRVEVRWAAEEPEQIALHWRETGGPPVVQPPRRGFGVLLVRQSIEHDLGGRLRFEFQPDGLAARFELPLGEIAAERGRRARAADS